MSRTALKVFLLLAWLVQAMPGPAVAQDAAVLADSLPARILFVTSGGYWEETEKATETEEAEGEASGLAEAAPQNRGYYRLVAIRGDDNRSLLQLQHIALTANGPELARSAGVEEINSLGAFITDIRPGDSTGAASGPGFAAYIYLKLDPTVAEPDTWALYIDEFGDIMVEMSSN